jgi:hypothetical protein
MRRDSDALHSDALYEMLVGGVVFHLNRSYSERFTPVL